ncbi:MAG: ATP/maltotriose-dependent transcriptional regulator MalT, partial [Cognaticolwellia sp.]
RTGNTRISATANYAAGSVMLAEGHYAEAQRLFKTARANAASSGDVRMQLNALNGEGEVARLSGETDEAEAVFSRYGKLAHQKGFALLEAVSHINRALIALSRGDYANAEALAAQAGQVLAHRPRSWPWLYIAMIRCAVSATKGEQAKSLQWWELAVDRGLEQVRSPDLATAVEVLVKAAQIQGWSEVEESAKRILEGVRG